MLFKELKAGYLVYILHKNDPISVSKGKVTTNPTTHIGQIGQFNPVNPQMGQMMVDITIEEGGVSKTYTMPEGSSVTYANDLVLATDREGILREVENMKAVSIDHLNQTKHHEEVVKACEQILADLNPAFKEKKENEERFGKIESDVRDVKSMITDLIKKLS